MYELQRHKNSDSNATKLVSYAEMEKRNQLIWITNEISHLSNLKKLLEEPKRKSDKLDKLSSRKVKHQQKQTNSKQQKFITSNYNHRVQNGHIAVIDDNILSRQWSSHCNLANCSSLIDTNIIKHLKKRNSCTQTATDHLLAYSKTGSEIVSAKIQNINIKLTNAYVQTLRSLQSPILDSHTSKVYL
jgi:hypothetical protein